MSALVHIRALELRVGDQINTACGRRTVARKIRSGNAVTAVVIDPDGTTLRLSFGGTDRVPVWLRGGGPDA